MTEFARNPETDEWLRRDKLSPRWVPSSQEEFEANQQNALQALGAGAVRTIADYRDLAVAGVSAAASGTAGLGQAPTEAQALERIGERDVERQAARQANPFSSLAGENLDILLGGAAAGGRALGGRAARTQARIQGTAGQLRELPGGVAGQRFEQALKTTGLSEVTTEPFVRSWNRKVVNTAVATRIGGKEIMESLAEANYKLTSEVLEEMTGNAISKINRAVPDSAVIDLSPYQSTLSRVRKVIKEDEFLEGSAAALAEQGIISGQQFKEVRRQLTKLAADSAKQGKGTKRDFITKTVERLDKLVANSNTEINQELYREGRAAYRMSIALLRNTAAISDDGFVSAKSLRNAMRTTYGTEYKRGNFGAFDPATADLMRTVERARSLGVQAPDSGTAQRAFLPAAAAAAALGIGN